MLDIQTPTSQRQRQIFWGALLLLVAVSVAAMLSVNRLIAAYNSSARSDQALLELDRYLSCHKDVEAGTRGYAFTRDPRFLESFESSLTCLPQSASRLKSLQMTEFALRGRVENLEQLTAGRVAIARQIVTLTAQNGENGLALAAMRDGLAAMDQVRAVVAETREAVQKTRVERSAFAKRQAQTSNIALAVGVGLSLLTLAWLFRLLSVQIARRQKVEEELRLLNDDLEQRVSARTAELEETRRLLDAVIENIPDTVFLKDVGNQFKYVLINKAGEILTGFDRAQVIGRVDHELFPKAEAERHRKEDEKVARSGETFKVSEQSIMTKHGLRVIKTCKILLALNGGEKTFILGIVHDLTESKALETQIREMQRLESVGRLTGGIAHDFNNLLAIIMGNVEMVRSELPDDSESAIIADEALEAVWRGAALVQRLLAFARKQHLEPTAVDLNDRLQDIIPLLERALGGNIRISVEPAKELWHAHIDATQVDDALVNLAVNARDAMPDGGSLAFETDNVVLDEDYAAHHSEVEPGDYVMLAVSDTGAGMNQDTVTRAFEPFFTTKAEGEGTGLGLSQVFGWVKQSGGHIKIYSEVDHGTTVKLYLPRATLDLLPEQKARIQEPDSNGHEIVLIVEDNPNVRRTVVRQLAQLGYTTIEAEDGDTALTKIKEGVAFDLLLTDVVMPGGMNGYELAEEVEKLRPHTKILFTSGYTELAQSNRNVTRRGRLLSKPYSRNDLGLAIRAALEEINIGV